MPGRALAVSGKKNGVAVKTPSPPPPATTAPSNLVGKSLPQEKSGDGSAAAAALTDLSVSAAINDPIVASRISALMGELGMSDGELPWTPPMARGRNGGLLFSDDEENKLTFEQLHRKYLFSVAGLDLNTRTAQLLQQTAPAVAATAASSSDASTDDKKSDGKGEDANTCFSFGKLRESLAASQADGRASINSYDLPVDDRAVESIVAFLNHSLMGFKRADPGNGADKHTEAGIDLSACSTPLSKLEQMKAILVAPGRRGGETDVDGKTAAFAVEAAAKAVGSLASGSRSDAGESKLLDILSSEIMAQALQDRGEMERLKTMRSNGNGATAAASAIPGFEEATALATVRELSRATRGRPRMMDPEDRMTKVHSLSQPTLDELAVDGGAYTASSSSTSVQPGEASIGSSRVGACLTECAAVVVAMLWSSVDLNASDPAFVAWQMRQETKEVYDALLDGLCQNLTQRSGAMWATEMMKHFGLSITTGVEDVYCAVNATALMLFFASKPLPLLERTCSELGVSLSDSANTDSNVMPELIAEKLAHLFYPMQCGRLSISAVSFLPRLQVHEHTPGSYTCTIDNASHMGRMLRERIVGNRFSCQKIKFRAVLIGTKGRLSLQVWHRSSTPLLLHAALRTCEPKKRKSKGGKGNGNGSAAAGEPERLATVCQLSERSVEAAPGVMVSLNDESLDLAVLLDSSSLEDNGCRTYSADTNRITFQLALTLSNIDGAPLDGTNASVTATGKPSQQGAPPEEEAANPSEVLEKAVSDLSNSETTARQSIEDASNLEYRHLSNEECRSSQQAQRKAEDRERKALLAQVGPSPELLRDVEKLTNLVQVAQQNIAKLAKEKAKEEREVSKTEEKVSQQRAELKQLLLVIEQTEAQITRVDRDTVEAEARIKEKNDRISRKETRRAEQSQWTALKRVLEPTMTSSHHDTLAINDFGTFLHSPAPSASRRDDDENGAADAAPPRLSTSLGFQAAASPPTANSLMASPGVLGGIAAFATDPFSVRPTGPSNGLGTAPPVFSTHPKLGAAIGSAAPGASSSLASPMVPPSPAMTSGISQMTNCSNPASSAAMTSGSVLMGGGSSSGGLSFGLAPSPFSTNPVSHTSHPHQGNGSLYTTLDANAQPFSPSPAPPGATMAPNSSAGAGVTLSSSSGGGGGGSVPFAFTVTAGVGTSAGVAVGNAISASGNSPLYQGGGNVFPCSEVGSMPSPFTTASVSGGGDPFGSVSNGGIDGRSPADLLSYPSSLQWTN